MVPLWLSAVPAEEMAEAEEYAACPEDRSGAADDALDDVDAQDMRTAVSEWGQ